VKCEACDGKGGLLVVPEVSQRRPSTGRIVSCGDKVKYFSTGQDVLYSNFAGHAMDIPLESGTVVLRILHESEILASVRGHLELRAVRNQREALGV
jgi:co-chaperonin GroES (HSP10)